ncbi:MAG: SPFH/Band 7/PHB domain protein [Anaerolinea sp.]|nr:SPFH/Band 7/PHB domain protein [Anaerolinea sp.]
MDGILVAIPTAAVTFVVLLFGEPIFRWFMRMFGIYAIVQEGTCQVYVLFGKVIGVINEPGLHLLWFKLGPSALIVNWFGKRHVLDMRLDQVYLRSLPVNSEEGAPMGIGVWYEMYISDPVAYLFKNTDPRGSLSANVSSATVRTLSNMPLGDMLMTRHVMSRSVRTEVSPKSHEWGYKLGSVYIRKVHFRDRMMIQQIEEKVVNRLRQVTSAIRQDGANRVSIITNSAERRAAVEFARAQGMRPQIVGAALQKIGEDAEVAKAMFEILETESVLKGQAEVALLPKQKELLTQLLAAETAVNNR